jgi:sugar-specific transcriptional regulator TrmB
MDRDDDPRTVAVEQLQSLGLSTYAARTYVALAALGQGSARDVAHVSDVPRTRVYDAVEELREEGLADVRESNPKLFWPVSVETCERHFDERYRRRLDRLTDALESVGTSDRPEQQSGVWTVTGREAVAERTVQFVREADDEVAFVTVEELLTDGVVDALRAAGQRGVSIRVAGVADGVEARIRDEVPGVEPFESLWEHTDIPAGRLLLVDRERTLVSVLAENGVPEREETAVWGSGEYNGLVVVVKGVFAWELGESE